MRDAEAAARGGELHDRLRGSGLTDARHFAAGFADLLERAASVG